MKRKKETVLSEKLLRSRVKGFNIVVYKDVFDEFWTSEDGVQYSNASVNPDKVALRTDKRDINGNMLFCSCKVTRHGMSHGGDSVKATLYEGDDDPQYFDGPLYFSEGNVCVDKRGIKFEVSIEPFELYLEKLQGFRGINITAPLPEGFGFFLEGNLHMDRAKEDE